MGTRQINFCDKCEGVEDVRTIQFKIGSGTGQFRKVDLCATDRGAMFLQEVLDLWESLRVTQVPTADELRKRRIPRVSFDDLRRADE